MTSSASAAAAKTLRRILAMQTNGGPYWVAQSTLEDAATALEAQRTDTLSELRAQIAERILIFKNASPPKVGGGQMRQLERMECDTAVRQLEWV